MRGDEGHICAHKEEDEHCLHNSLVPPLLLLRLPPPLLPLPHAGVSTKGCRQEVVVRRGGKTEKPMPRRVGFTPLWGKLEPGKTSWPRFLWPLLRLWERALYKPR